MANITTPCLTCLGQKELLALAVQALMTLSDSAVGANGSVYTGPYDNPNGNVTPLDTAHGAIYYQHPSITLYNQWDWDVPTQAWIQVIAPT